MEMQFPPRQPSNIYVPSLVKQEETEPIADRDRIIGKQGKISSMAYVKMFSIPLLMPLNILKHTGWRKHTRYEPKTSGTFNCYSVTRGCWVGIVFLTVVEGCNTPIAPL